MGDKEREALHKKFENMMQALFRQEGASLDIDLLASDEAQDFIRTHAAVLDSSFRQVEMSDTMRRHLTESDYIFSGLKTFHELNEAFPSLLDENGNRKPFEQFLNDVRKVDETYNRNYLYAEYNFVQSAAAMAARWEDFEADGDRYNLQYRTMRDDKVRPEHAALDGTTLPPSDPFWDAYYPPNGWNCFIEGTPVLTQNGWRSIESIRKGDLVVGGSGKLREVIGTHTKLVDEELVSILTKGALTTCTPNHRFCTPHGWVSAENLKPGDIIIQMGEVSAFHLLVHAIANACTLLRYGLMACVRKWEVTTTLTINNKVERRNKKIDHISAKKFSLLEWKSLCRQIGMYDFFAFTQWGTQCAHTLRMKSAGFKRTMQCLRFHIRAKKRGANFELFSYASNEFAVLLGLSLTNVKSLCGKFMVGLRKAFTRFYSSFRIANPLRSHSITAMPDGDAKVLHNTVNGSSIHLPMQANPSEATHLNKIPAFRGIKDVHSFNGFHSFFDFLRNTFLHNRYVLVEGKITKNRRETIVYNLSVCNDESYVVPVGITHNCRCSVVQVRKSKYPETSSAEANRRGEEALKNDTRGMFRFNAGKMQKTMPDYNPYTIRRCRDCDVVKGKATLAFIPDYQLCRACVKIRECYQEAEKRNKENLPKLKPREKHEVYMQPIEEQFKDIAYKSKTGHTVSRHILKDKKEMDYNRVLDTAILFTQKEDVRILPEIHKSETYIRDLLGLPEMKNPDLVVGSTFIDVKSPFAEDGISSNASKAARQGARVCITDHLCFLNERNIDQYAHWIFKNPAYPFNEAYFVINGKLYEKRRLI